MSEEEKKVYQGIVVWFNKTYGFIEYYMDGVQQVDIFCHYSDIVSNGYKTLFKGQQVQFSIGINHKNQPKAIEVSALKH